MIRKAIRRRIRRWLARFDFKDVGDWRFGGEPLFRRYVVLKTRWGAVYLHEFFRSDADTCLHDHPWGFVSVILRGGYYEEMRKVGFPHYRKVQERIVPPDPLRAAPAWRTVEEANPVVMHWRRPGMVLVRRAGDAHRIVLKPFTRPWSLVLVRAKSRDWGFYTRSGYTPFVEGMIPICEEVAP